MRAKTNRMVDGTGSAIYSGFMQPDRSEDDVRDLDAPIKSFRVFALERAIQEGHSPQLLEALRGRMAAEDDEECLLLLRHAIRSVEQRLSSGDESSRSNEPIDWQQAYEKASSAQRLVLLRSLTPKKSASLSHLAPQWLREESDPLVQASLVRAFGPHWPEESLQQLSRCLFSRFVSVSLATLEVLVQTRPKALEQGLPRFLSSPDPRVWGLAIRGLAQINLDDAIEHFETMLGSAEQRDRQNALQLALYLPFDRVKLPLLSFLAGESELELIEQAGTLLAINPDPDVPFRLCVLKAQAGPEKAIVIDRHLQSACRALQKSGMLDVSYETWLHRLEDWQLKVSDAALFRQIVAPFLATGVPEDCDLSPLVALPLSRRQWLCSESDKWRLPDTLKEHVKRILSAPTTVSPASANDSIAPSDLNPEQLPTEDLIRFLALWAPKEREIADTELQRLMTRRGMVTEVRAAIMRAALRLEIGSLVAVARESLRLADEQLVAESLRYLARFDVEAVFPIIGQYLQSSSLRLKSTAVKILKQFDSRQALSSVQALLQSPLPARQSLALACMMNFDFPLVRPMLVEFLQKSCPSETLSLALSLFLSNPDAENPYLLYCLEKQAEPEVAATIAVARQQCEATLTAVGIWRELPDATTRANWEKRRQEELRRRHAPPSLCSVKRSRQASWGAEWQSGGLEAVLRLSRQWMAEHVYATLIGVMGFVAGVGLLLIVLTYEVRPPALSAKSGPLLAISRDVAAVVRARHGEIGMLDCISSDGLEFLLLDDGQPPRLKKGDQFEGEILPFRCDSSGKVIAQKRLIRRR